VSEYGKSRAHELKCVPALRSVDLTRGVSRIVEFPLGGLALMGLTIHLTFQTCNNSEQRAIDVFQPDARLAIQLWVMLLFFSRQRRLPPYIDTDVLTITKSLCWKVVNLPMGLAKLPTAAMHGCDETSVPKSIGQTCEIFEFLDSNPDI
jgi:hypothetical protein